MYLLFCSGMLKKYDITTGKNHYLSFFFRSLRTFPVPSILFQIFNQALGWEDSFHTTGRSMILVWCTPFAHLIPQVQRYTSNLSYIFSTFPPMLPMWSLAGGLRRCVNILPGTVWALNMAAALHVLYAVLPQWYLKLSQMFHVTAGRILRATYRLLYSNHSNQHPFHD